MNILVDTHAVLWWLFDSSRLSSRSRKILEDSSNHRWVSIVSLWEIAIKISTGKLGWDQVTVQHISSQLLDQQFSLLPIRIEDLSPVQYQEFLHRDPFDRMLIAQAQELGVPLLTNDAKIKQYSVKTIW